MMTDIRQDGTYRLYPQRYLVLLAYSFLYLTGSWIWASTSPIASLLADNWSVSLTDIDALSSIFLSGYIVFAGPALYLLHLYHLRFGLMCAGVLNFVGAVVRFYGARDYFWVYVGSWLCSIAQAFIPPIFAEPWFGGHERAMATSLGFISGQVGSALGLGATSLVQFGIPHGEEGVDLLNEETLVWYFGIQMAFSAVSIIMVIIWVEDRPPTPPSEAAAIAEWQEYLRSKTNDEKLEEGRKLEHHQTSAYGSFSRSTDTPTMHTLAYMESVTHFLTNPSCWFLSIVYGLVLGGFYAMATFMSQFVVPDTNGLTYAQGEAGTLGFVYVLAGFIGCISAGYWVDHTHEYHLISKLYLIGALVFQVVFLVSVCYIVAWPWLTKVVANLGVALLGFFVAGFCSIGLEYGAAIAYPADEAVVSGLLTVSGQVFGCLMIHVGGLLSNPGWSLNLILVASLVLSLVFLDYGVTAPSRRPSN